MPEFYYFALSKYELKVGKLRTALTKMTAVIDKKSAMYKVILKNLEEAVEESISYVIRTSHLHSLHDILIAYDLYLEGIAARMAGFETKMKDILKDYDLFVSKIPIGNRRARKAFKKTRKEFRKVLAIAVTWRKNYKDKHANNECTRAMIKFYIAMLAQSY